MVYPGSTSPRWRVVLIALTGVLSMLVGVGRFEEGGTGFLVWCPIAPAVLSFAAVALMWRDGFGPDRRDRA